MKILINTPDISLLGGVANHYKGLQPFWSQNVKYNFIGGRKGIPGPMILFYDYIKFFFLCLFGNYDAILLNPSLGKTALKRDAVFLKISKLFKIKTIVFIHGWDKKVEESIDLNPSQFCTAFNRSDGFITLATIFKKQLKKWGITKPIHLSTTKVNDNLLGGFDISKKEQNQQILFLARLEENKGIKIALKAFKIVLEKYPNAKLKVAGNGAALESSKQLVADESIKNVAFLGSISGSVLTNLFIDSSIYILPTTHGEGLPTSVLEAMAFGLPVITRPVGGLVDIFEENKMGYLLESLNPKDYADRILDLLEDTEKTKQISLFNHNYAKKNFMASKVALEIEKILNN